MFAEFKKYEVFPLDATVATRLATPRPSLIAGRRVFNYSGEPVVGIPGSTAPVSSTLRTPSQRKSPFPMAAQTESSSRTADVSADGVCIC